MSLLQSFLNLFRRVPVNCSYRLQSKENQCDYRRAFRWDGKDREALRKFLGHLQVSWHSSGGVTIAGYGQIYLAPGTFIWDDSDGYDSGSLATVQKQYYIFEDHSGV